MGCRISSSLCGLVSWNGRDIACDVRALEETLAEHVQLMSDSQRRIAILKGEIDELLKGQRDETGDMVLQGALLSLRHEQNQSRMARKLIEAVGTSISNVKLRSMAAFMQMGARKIDIERHRAQGIMDKITEAGDRVSDVIGDASDLATELESCQLTCEESTLDELLRLTGMATPELVLPTVPKDEVKAKPRVQIQLNA